MSKVLFTGLLAGSFRLRGSVDASARTVRGPSRDSRKTQVRAAMRQGGAKRKPARFAGRACPDQRMGTKACASFTVLCACSTCGIAGN